MTRTLANFSTTTLNGAINNSTTTIVLTNAATFPATGTFTIRIDDELINITSRSTNTLTAAARGSIEGTSAASHSDATAVYGPLTLLALEEYIVQVGAGITLAGELGGTAATATVDATHSGSAHHTQAHEVLEEASHSDVTNSTPNDTDLLTWDDGTSAWIAADAEVHGAHGGGTGRGAYMAMVYKNDGTHATAIQADGTVIQSSTTNYSTAINAAITYVAGAGGGRVFVSAGDYTLTATLTVDASVSLYGEQVSGRFNDGGLTTSNGTTFIGTLDPMVQLVATATPTVGYGQWVDSIAFHNVGAMGTTKGVQVQCMDTTVSNCSFYNYGIAVDVMGNSLASTAAVANRIIFCQTNFCGQSIVVDRTGTQTNNPTDGQILGCRFLAATVSSATYAVDIAAGGWHIVMNHFTDNAGGAGHLQCSSSRSFVLNNYFDTGGMNYKVNLSGTEGQCMNNLFLGSGSGVQLNVGASYGIVCNNFFQGSDTATTPIRYAAAQSTLKGQCSGNVMPNFTNMNALIVDSTGAPIYNGYTNGAANSLWPEFSCYGNGGWT